MVSGVACGNEKISNSGMDILKSNYLLYVMTRIHRWCIKFQSVLKAFKASLCSHYEQEPMGMYIRALYPVDCNRTVLVIS